MMSTPGFSFDVTARDGHARTALLQTPHGPVETPTFMPVGTIGTVKGLTMEEVGTTDAGIVLGNTYHLWLRPGAEVVQALGGLHGFSRWPRAMLTDSGGFQVFSLAKLRTMDDDGVTFRSHIDGALKRLTPEESVRVQSLLGSDIAMVLDECPPGDADRAAIERAMERTTKWARRCLDAPRGPGQALFGIVQGGIHEDLRLRHLESIAAMPFDGVALGGLSVGEPVPDMHRVLRAVAHQMPDDRPRYLMGVGTPRDLLVGALAGVDMFDCVLPTRNARNGQCLTWRGRVNIKQARHRLDDGPIDPRCEGQCCNGAGGRYTRGYLRHLFLAGEILAARVMSLHNVYFLGSLMRGMRAAIREGRAAAYVDDTLRGIAEGDEVGPPSNG
ncbi:MAG: tRNA guanosine(34) transglycosylase Tgt [Myxococcales bacterium]|jgi:queuine tRNA-ribosyltransferase|nr:tRNA guanosine(34) transglycosylase Tgt [Myxococcales bacterium]